MNYNAFTHILTFEHKLEASILLEILNEQNIPYELKTYHDSAYGALWQHQKGWGSLWVPEACVHEVEQLWQDIQTAPAIEPRPPVTDPL